MVFAPNWRNPLATDGLQIGYFGATKQNAHLEWAFVQAKCLILLVAREGFEPPTWLWELFNNTVTIHRCLRTIGVSSCQHWQISKFRNSKTSQSKPFGLIVALSFAGALLLSSWPQSRNPIAWLPKKFGFIPFIVRPKFSRRSGLKVPHWAILPLFSRQSSQSKLFKPRIAATLQVLEKIE